MDEEGIWKLWTEFLLPREVGIRSSSGISMTPVRALKRQTSLDLALRSSRGTHFRDSMFFFVFPPMRTGLLVTKRAALFWVFSSCSMWFFWWGSQTQLPYSSDGRTNAL